MFFAHEQDVTEKYFFFSQGSNGAAKINSYLSIPANSLISLSNAKYENKINTGQLRRDAYSHKQKKKEKKTNKISTSGGLTQMV